MSVPEFTECETECEAVEIVEIVETVEPVTTFDPSQPGRPAARPHARRRHGGRTSRREWLRNLAAVFGGLGAGGLIYWRLSERLEITHQRIDLGLGPQRSLRVVALSDLHLDGTPESYAPLIDAVQEEQPDLFVLVGDTVDYRNGPEMVDLISLFSAVDAPRGKLATLGNWEYGSVGDFGELGRIFQRAGIRLLINERVELPGLQIVGVDDWVFGVPDLPLIETALASGPSLILSHCPIVMDDVTELELPRPAPWHMLSGHTHGGQVSPLGVSMWTPTGSGRYVSGPYGQPGSSLHVMRGVGYSGLPVRVGARPELAVIELV